MNIDKLLDKFRKVLDKQDGYKDKIIEIIKNITGVEIEKENIKTQKGNLMLNVNSYIRTEIYLHKNKILEEFKNKIPDKTIKDIK